jgi:hypothetical protein
MHEQKKVEITNRKPSATMLLSPREKTECGARVGWREAGTSVVTSLYLLPDLAVDLHTCLASY